MGELVIILIVALPLVLALFAVMGLLCLIRTKPNFRRWFLWCGLVPLLSLCCALYIFLTPVPVPLDYQEGIDPDTGRQDFLALVFYGFAIPFAYLCVSVPVRAIYLWARSRR